MNKYVFTVKVKKEQDLPGFEIPLHKEYEFVKSLGKSKWVVRNSENNSQCVVEKEKMGEFVFYNFICSQLI